MTNKTKTQKPKMSRLEADWHQHKAGVQASAEAKSGECDAGLAALDHATPATIPAVAGWELRPPTAGTWIELTKAAAYFSGLPEPADKGEEVEREARFAALQQLVFADALRLRRLRDAEGWAGVIAEADRINYELTREERLTLARHMGAAMALMDALKDPEGHDPAPEADPAEAGK